MALVVSIAGCATAPVERPAQSRSTGEQVVTIEMVRFTFEPEVVTLKAGTPLRITAASNSRIPHNVTVLSLDGQVIKAVDIPGRATETFEVTLPKPGRYIFYCDKFLHRWPFGMEGTLVANEVVTALAGVLTLLVLAAVPVPAAAHGILLESTPTAGETAPLGIRALDLRFNVRIESRFSKLRLAGPSGEDVPLREEPASSARLTATPPLLAPGIYTVRWQVFTGDGHLSHGRFSFQVGGRK